MFGESNPRSERVQHTHPQRHTHVNNISIFLLGSESFQALQSDFLDAIQPQRIEISPRLLHFVFKVIHVVETPGKLMLTSNVNKSI